MKNASISSLGCDTRALLWGMLLYLLLFSPNLFLLLGGGEKSILSLPGLSFLLLSCGLNLMLLGLFRRPWILFLLCLPFYIALLPEIYFIWTYRVPSTVNIVATTLTGDIHEAIQYVGPLLTPAILGIVALLALWFYGVRALYTDRCSLAPRLRQTLVALGCLAIALIFIKNLIKNGHDADGTFNQTAVNIERTFPVGFAMRLWSVYDEQRSLSRIAERIATFRFNAHLKEQPDDPGLNVVLIIGESLRQASWSLGGYPRNTTPRLSEEPGLIPYSNATAEASLTRTAVPLMITRATADDFNRHLEEKTLLGLFSEAGYETWWLSNQEQLGINNTTITAHTVEADHVAFYNRSGLSRSASVTPHDDVLLAPLAHALEALGPQHRFVIVHTMGSHWDYNYRYPDAFDHWKPSLRGRTGYSLGDQGIKTEMINAYDNSVRFTDQFLAETIALLKSSPRPGVLIFMSDHGENLLDDHRKLTGHAHDSAWELQVPLFFWATESYRVRYPDIWKQVLSHRDLPVSANNLFYSVAELGRISFSDNLPTLSIANVAFQAVPRRFFSVNGKVLSTEQVLERDRLP